MKREPDGNPLVWVVSYIIERSRRDGESFWIFYIRHRDIFDILDKSEKYFLLAILGREIGSADDILTDLMAKTLAFIESL